MTLGKCLTELQSGSDGNKWFPKTKFTEYTGIKGKTPQNLSIDHHQNFVNTHPDLSREGMYLFRLGRGTFSLVQAKNILEDYFVDDNMFPKRRKICIICKPAGPLFLLDYAQAD